MPHMVEANGAEIPAIGLGTWDLRGTTCEACVDAALGMGYRHIDTATMYDNETEVGNAIRASSVPRGDIFLTTKVWHDDAADGACQRSVEGSLKRLGVDYVDLILLHWPSPDVALAETMGALCDVKRRGLARHIGVSNFTSGLLREAVARSDEPVVVNQVEYHPYLDQSAVHDECRRHGVALTAYSPLARGRVFDDPLLRKIAEDHNKTPGQVTLRWLVQQEGVVAIPRSSKPERIAEAFDIDGFTLSGDEMQQIAALGSSQARLVDYSWSPDWD